MPIGILGTGSYLPERVVLNTEICEWVTDATPEWITGKTGIRQRHYAAEHEATSDLATEAGRRALAAAGVEAGQIDYLIVSTSTGDYPQPPTSALVQHALGASAAAAFDVNAVCAGFVHAVVLAQSLTTTRPGTHALVIGAEIYSRFSDYGDKRISTLLGDGAGAAVVGPAADGGIVGFELSTDGAGADLIRAEVGGSRRPPTPESVADREHMVHMKGRAVREYVLENVPPAVGKLLAGVGCAATDIGHVVPHQPNGMLLTELSEACGLSAATTHRTVEECGNMGSASIPVTLDAAVTSGAIRPGDLVLLMGFGGGMAVGNCLLRWSGAGTEA